MNFVTEELTCFTSFSFVSRMTLSTLILLIVLAGNIDEGDLVWVKKSKKTVR